MANTRKAIETFSNLNKKVEPIGGLLGVPIGGSKKVDVPNRPGFVYVRLRDNANELVQAYNEQVSAVYDLPVLVEFKNNRYVIVGRDSDRYNNWGTSSSYIPAHASQHSLLANQFGGGDPVWVDGRQMMPAAVYPSGTVGGPNVLLSEYILRGKLGNWIYVGNTGTPDLASQRPNGSLARMMLVCLDYTSGGFVILTGTTFSASITGTSAIVPFLPVTNIDQVPIAAVRIPSGTTTIGWDNIYDARQWIDSGYITGSSGGGSATAAGVTGSVQFKGADGLFDFDTHFYYAKTGSSLTVGNLGIIDQFSPTPIFRSFVQNKAPVVSLNVWSDALGDGAQFFGFSSNGIPDQFGDNWEAIKDNRRLVSLIGAGYANTSRNIGGRLSLRANQDWSTTGSGSKWVGTLVKNNEVSEFTFFTADGTSVQLYLPVDIPEIDDASVGTPSSGLGRLRVDPDDQHLKFKDSVGLESDLLSGKTTAESNSNDIFRCDSPGGASLWTGTISGAPAGTSVTVSAPVTGTEGVLVPVSTSQLSKMRLYNTTRGNSALISNYNAGTNVVTLVSTVPANWANGDALTVTSQTVSGGGVSWVDLEITSGPTGKSSLFTSTTIIPSAAGEAMRVHPLEAFGAGKIQATFGQVVAVNMNGLWLTKIISNVFSLSWTGTPTAVILREVGYIQ